MALPNEGNPVLPQVHRELELLEKVITTRLNAMDRASEVLAENVNRVPTLLDRELLRLTQLFEEKALRLTEALDEKLVPIKERFDSIQKQFDERDVRADKVETAQKEMSIARAQNAATAVAVALQNIKDQAAQQNTANSDAISKRESSVSDQLKGIQALLASTNTALNDKISVINGRLDRGEGGSNANSSSVTMAVSIGSVIVALVAVFLSISHSQNAGITIPAPATISSQVVK